MCKKHSKEEYYPCFLNEQGEQIDNIDIDPKTIALEMEENGLIWMNGENCKLLPKGEEICNDKGWIKYKELENKKIQDGNSKDNTINIFGDNKGNVLQSLENKAFKSPATQTMNHTTANEPIKKSLSEILAWTTGTIASVILIYEFIIKQWI